MHFLAPASFKATLRTLGFAAAVLGTSTAQATIMEFHTNMDNRSFKVNLYDKATPETVKNFLAYLDAGAYENVIIHRSAKKEIEVDIDGVVETTIADFVIQGGGYTYSGELPLGVIASRRDVDDIDDDGNKNEVIHPINEPKFSNIEGTIAMAKQPNAPHSATSQWFINVENNSEILDAQNGGFTVFGQVIEGMDVVEDIADLQRFRMGTFLEIPLRNYDIDDARDNEPVTEDNLVIITNIVVLDDREDTADGLTPTPNSLVETIKDDEDDSSGSLGLFGLLLLMGLSLSRCTLSRK